MGVRCDTRPCERTDALTERIAELAADNLQLMKEREELNDQLWRLNFAIKRGDHGGTVKLEAALMELERDYRAMTETARFWMQKFHDTLTPENARGIMLRGGSDATRSEVQG